MSKSEIERRLTLLETKFEELKSSAKSPWWHDAVGAFEGDVMFAKAMKIGRKYRQSQRSVTKRAKKKEV